MNELPMVSVVVPMLDELGAIEECLAGFAAQSYSLQAIEILVVDGGSIDGSRELVEKRAAEVDWIRVVDNPKRRASAAFNAGVAAARGDVVCLFSAHGVPDPDYIARSVAVLLETGADGVGGLYRHVGTEPESIAIGLAMVSPYGMASPHRFATSRQEADTISHPAYRADALARVGPFNEDLQRNSDYELNWRLREQGARLVFDPTIVSIYRPRASLAKLARQFWWYGRWKERVIRAHPRSLKPRHLVPPAAVVTGATAPLLMLGRRGRLVVVLGAVAYATVIGLALRRARPRAHGASVPALVACFPIMHASWGAGFLLSFVEDTVRGSNPASPENPTRKAQTS